MSTKKLVFRVGAGLAATGIALSIGACTKDAPNVNTVPIDLGTTAAPAPPVNVNTVPSPPSTNNADAGNENGTSGTTGTVLPEKAPDIRVNTIPSRPSDKADE